MALGPVILDIVGTALTPEDRDLLKHPLVGGVILFTRNYENADQLEALVTAIRALREPHLVVAVDHEGGRVQRFRDGFTRLPPAGAYGALYDREPRRAVRLAELGGWLMASELRAVGVDFSFAPVLDLGRGISRVIGDRAFHHNPEVVAELAGAFMQGMRRAGMSATGKHFPGHGGVPGDSHEEIPVDDRRYEDIFADDVLPFERMVRGGLAAVMPAHVIYPRADRRAAGFSPFWLKEVLRHRLGFQGLIFSDDLNMAGAGSVGDYAARARAALAAGCDVLLVCNNRPAALQVLRDLEAGPNPVLNTRLARMHGRNAITRADLHRSVPWKEAVAALRELGADPTLELAL